MFGRKIVNFVMFGRKIVHFVTFGRKSVHFAMFAANSLFFGVKISLFLLEWKLTLKRVNFFILEEPLGRNRLFPALRFHTLAVYFLNLLINNSLCNITFWYFDNCKEQRWVNWVRVTVPVTDTFFCNLTLILYIKRQNELSSLIFFLNGSLSI